MAGRTQTLHRLTTQLREVHRTGRQSTPQLEESLREVARTNPAFEPGTSMLMGGERMQYHQARLEFVEAARAIGARVD